MRARVHWETTQRFGYRIDQPIPQNRIALVMSSDKQPEKRRRGRPPKVSKPAQPEDSLRPKEVSKQVESPLHDNLPVTLPGDTVVENSDCNSLQYVTTTHHEHL